MPMRKKYRDHALVRLVVGRSHLVLSDARQGLEQGNVIQLASIRLWLRVDEFTPSDMRRESRYSNRWGSGQGLPGDLAPPDVMRCGIMFQHRRRSAAAGVRGARTCCGAAGQCWLAQLRRFRRDRIDHRVATADGLYVHAGWWGAVGKLYHGTISRFGLDIGATAGGSMVWAVFSEFVGPRPGCAGRGLCRRQWRSNDRGRSRRQCAGRRIQPSGRVAAALGQRTGRARLAVRVADLQTASGR